MCDFSRRRDFSLMTKVGMIFAMAAGVCLLGGSVTVAQGVSAEARTLKDGSCLRLRLAEEVNSGSARVGKLVHFEVTEEVKLGDVVILAKGQHATGVVTAVEPKGRLGGDGVVRIAPKFAQLANGEEVALRSTATAGNPMPIGSKGHGKRFFADPGVLMRWFHGQDGRLEAGSEVVAYINGDMRLDAGGFARLRGGR